MKINEDNFIIQMRLRNERALEYVCGQYGGLIRAIVAKKLFYLHNIQEDCVNDILYAVWEHIDSYDPAKNTFKNWVAAIAQYKCIDYMRKHLKECSHQPLDETVQTETAGGDDGPLEQLIQEELSEQTEKMLSCLNDRDKNLFMLLYVKEQDMEQVSRELGLKREVVYNRISRAKSRIRSLFPDRVKGEQQ